MNVLSHWRWKTFKVHSRTPTYKSTISTQAVHACAQTKISKELNQILTFQYVNIRKYFGKYKAEVDGTRSSLMQADVNELVFLNELLFAIKWRDEYNMYHGIRLSFDAVIWSRDCGENVGKVVWIWKCQPVIPQSEQENSNMRVIGEIRKTLQPYYCRAQRAAFKEQVELVTKVPS